MCANAQADFSPQAWALLETLFGPLGPTPTTASAPVEIRPTDPIPLIHQPAAYQFRTARWGLIPRRMTAAQARAYAMFNARAETVATSPAFRDAFTHPGATQGRGLIPLSSFTEYPTQNGQKIKVRIARPDGKPLLAAALWTQLDDGTYSATLLTRPPNPGFCEIHDRQPALLLTRHLPRWLTGTPEQARDVALHGWPDGLLTATPWPAPTP